MRGLDLDLQPGSLVAVVGPSGAGKSSLAFGTLYAEGQRRYVESFSAYARQFLERLARPPVDELEPVAAGIAVDRAAPVRTSRSTVGTMTEVADYAKSLWARAASLSCPTCGRPVTREAPEAIADQVLDGVPDGRIVVSAPMPAGPDAETFLGVREALVRDGYRRLVRDERVEDLDGLAPSRAVGGDLDVVVDRLVGRSAERGRLVEALEAAMSLSGGRADVRVDGLGVFRYSRDLHCPHCDETFRDPTPGLFSFNSPVGACEACRGFGRTIGVDWERVFPDPSLSLARGAIHPWRGKSTAWERRYLKRAAKAAGVPFDKPLSSFSDAQLIWLRDGEPDADFPDDWVGLQGWFRWLNTRTYKMHVRVLLSRYRSYDLCTTCDGTRLKDTALAWRLGGRSIAEFFRMPVADGLGFLRGDAKPFADDGATGLLRRECEARLSALTDVGLGYLTLDRASRTLSGGEAQRVALTSALGASLTGALFVLDEPTVGLHPVDVERLQKVVRRLTDQDNTVLLVEHDEAMIRGAERVLELGPGAGEHGGQLVFDGPPDELAKADTATGRMLRAPADDAGSRREAKHWLSLTGAHGNNLRGVDIRVPLGALTCVTGVSGSGKSSLILETLVPAALRARGERSESAPLPFDGLEGGELLTGVTHVDQSPLGRTSRGNPATYLKAWDLVRKRFAAEPLAQERGYGPGFFSFNVAGGRCETCAGEGAETVEMQFLADVSFSCPDCGGRRFVGPVLDVQHRGLSAADVLDLTVDEAVERFRADKGLADRVAPAQAVGLGYLRLGQPLNTLSGGEAQRLKLAAILAKSKPGALVVLDEPTAGLHRVDIEPLMSALESLVRRGDTVVVVEHDMRVAARADHVIDLGPGAGAEGGSVVATGTPEAVAVCGASQTAPHLRIALGIDPAPPVEAPAPRPPREDRGIQVTRAREHNLKSVSVTVPRDQLVVVTGPSGSGRARWPSTSSSPKASAATSRP